MPTRMLREGILTSEPVSLLSWPAEVFYRRLMSAVDDFGRYYAKPELLRAACYPLQLDKVGNSDIAKWLGETQKTGLVRVYTVTGKEFLEIVNFRQQVRAKHGSKYPAPPTDAKHMHSTCEADVTVVVDVDVDAKGQQRSSGKPDLFAKFYAAYPRKVKPHAAEKAFKKVNPDEPLLQVMLRAIDEQKQSEQWKAEGGKYIPHPATWLNGGEWKNELPKAIKEAWHE